MEIENEQPLLLKGKPVADSIKKDLANRVEKLNSNGIVPKLAAVLIGDDPASHIYVNNKSKAFHKAHCHSEIILLPQNTTELHLLEIINQLNMDSKTHGILVQLPIPKSIDQEKILNAINPEKDVDGFHPFNLGCLLNGNPQFIPCTPHGMVKILEHYNIETSGKHAVIIGRSNIVGKPMFALLAQKFEKGNATVTICHTGTRDINQFTETADILVVAAGSPEYIKGHHIKEGAVILDVGINRVNDSKSEKGFKVVGDVDFESVSKRAGAITPVPRGVGPMTITMLLYNTILAAEQQNF